MLNKKLLSVAVASALLSGVAATSVQAFDITANVALVSDYRFRGISQTGEDAAVQGGFDASWEPGFYLGTWASSVNFDDPGDGSGSYGTMEIDYYAGWAGPIGDTDFGIDAGYMYYQYPGDTVDPDGDYQEFYLKGSWRDLGLGVIYSDDYYAESDKFWRVQGEYSLNFAEDFSLGLSVGYNMTEETEYDSIGNLIEGGALGCSRGGGSDSATSAGGWKCDSDDYVDYSISLGYNFKGVDFSVAWVGTDLDDEDCFDSNNCDGTAVFAISKSL
jgi:uncharacterized protein (TIGR02001 family)